MIKTYEIKTLVPTIDWNITDKEIEQSFKKRYINNTLKHLEFDDIDNSKLCYHYAFGNSFSFDGAIDYLFDRFSHIDIKTAKKGDIITYESYGEITHFAVIYKTDNTIKGTIIRSKWGRCGVYESDLSSVPKSYGNKIEIWRKNAKC